MAFAIPDLNELIGEVATLRATGQVMIPVMESGDDVVSRSLGMDASFNDLIKPVSDESRILLKPQGYSDPGKISGFWFWLALAIGALSLLLVVGSRLDDPDEASE